MLAQAKLLTGDAPGARSTLLEVGGGETLPQLQFPTRAAWLRMLAHAELALGDLASAELSVQRAKMTASVSGLNGHRGHASLEWSKFWSLRSSYSAAWCWRWSVSAGCSPRSTPTSTRV